MLNHRTAKNLSIPEFTLLLLLLKPSFEIKEECMFKSGQLHIKIQTHTRTRMCRENVLKK